MASVFFCIILKDKKILYSFERKYTFQIPKVPSLSPAVSKFHSQKFFAQGMQGSRNFFFLLRSGPADAGGVMLKLPLVDAGQPLKGRIGKYSPVMLQKTLGIEAKDQLILPVEGRRNLITKFPCDLQVTGHSFHHIGF